MPKFPRGLNLKKIDTPAYIVELDKLEDNLRILKEVGDASGARILLALKGFSMYSTFPMVKKYLCGTASSGLNEAMLARQYFGGEIHVYNPAFKEDEIEILSEFAHTIVFNSAAQVLKYAPKARQIAKREKNGRLCIGLRVNPGYSEVKTALYNPCAPCSRLGATVQSLDDSVIKHVDMLHFHALCEQDSGVLKRVLDRFDKKFARAIGRVKSLNFGGGHHITRAGYDIPLLVSLVKKFYKKYPNITSIYLEPGETVALDAGVFAARVLDIVENSKRIAILDCSATCHMPDVLEMPYRPQVEGAGNESEKKFDYVLSGRSCLAGDVIGVYSFDKKLNPGDVLLFKDMAHYTMVKTTTFNGMNLPNIATWSAKKATYKVIKKFGYNDFKRRL